MTIDKEKLISLLVKKTGYDQTEVKKQLDELVQRIRAAAEQGKTFEIENLGTFSMEDDQLKFTPSETLETEINNKYTGMKPIELIGAFDEPEAAETNAPSEEKKKEAREQEKEQEKDEEPKESKDVWAFDEDAMAETEAEQEQEEQVEEKPEEVSKELDLPEAAETEEPEPDPDVFEESIAEKFDQPTTETGPEPEQKPEAKPDPDPEPRPAAKTESLDEKPKPRSRSVATKRSDDNMISRVLMVISVILVLGVGGWILYDVFWADSDTKSNNQPVANQQVEESQVPIQQTGNNQDQVSSENTNTGTDAQKETSEPGSAMEVTNQENAQPESTEPEAGQQDQNPYGLRGEVNNSITNGYTIVLHSLSSMANAEKNQQKLQDEGYRAVINKADVNGTIYFRVGVGQFKTVEAAQQAAGNLPDPYNSNNFIKRITQ